MQFCKRQALLTWAELAHNGRSGREDGLVDSLPYTALLPPCIDHYSGSSRNQIGVISRLSSAIRQFAFDMISYTELDDKLGQVNSAFKIKKKLHLICPRESSFSGLNHSGPAAQICLSFSSRSAF
jgi:hypothetical protein